MVYPEVGQELGRAGWIELERKTRGKLDEDWWIVPTNNSKIEEGFTHQIKTAIHVMCPGWHCCQTTHMSTVIHADPTSLVPPLQLFPSRSLATSEQVATTPHALFIISCPHMKILFPFSIKKQCLSLFSFFLFPILLTSLIT